MMKCVLSLLSVLSLLDYVAAIHGVNSVRGDSYNYRQIDSQDDMRSNKHSAGGCRLPERWKGKWFQSGTREPIIIDDRGITTKGNCSESHGDKFLFMEPNSFGFKYCYKCLVINARHQNVLQYKESLDCEEKDTLENLCSQIPGDAPLNSLFRYDSPLEECPFKGAPFTFSYNRGHGECKSHMSHVDVCTENTKLLLRYQACPDVAKTESLQEELHCMATWKEGSQHYLVGKVYHRLTMSNEDSYRCFIYEKIKGHNRDRDGPHPGISGFRVSQSEDATCAGVNSPTEGARTLVFSRVEQNESKCKFPNWLVSHHWHTLNGKFSAKFHHSNTSFHVISEESRKNASQHSLNDHNFGGHSRNDVQSYFVGGSRIFCVNRRDMSDRQMTVTARHVNGCKTTTVCMSWFKRDNHVVELQIKAKDDVDSDCDVRGGGGGSLSSVPFVTLVSSEASASSHRCPYLGKYTAAASSNSVESQDGRGTRNLNSCGPSSFNALVVGCGNTATMEFHSNCPNQEPTTSYACHGSWNEGETGYLIASPLSRSSSTARRFCFKYTSNAEGGLHVSKSSEHCRRNAGGPGVDGTWAFKSDGQCADYGAGAVTAGSTSIMISTCDTSLRCALFVIVVLLTSLLVNHQDKNQNSSLSSSFKSSSTSSSSSSSSLQIHKTKESQGVSISAFNKSKSTQSECNSITSSRSSLTRERHKEQEGKMASPSIITHHLNNFQRL